MLFEHLFVSVFKAERNFTYAYIVRPSVFDEKSVFQQSKLHRYIKRVECLSQDISPLEIGGVVILPYLIGDCAYTFSSQMMKTFSEAEQAAQCFDTENHSLQTRANRQNAILEC